jgi:hypothetical protein
VPAGSRGTRSCSASSRRARAISRCASVPGRRPCAARGVGGVDGLEPTARERPDQDVVTAGLSRPRTRNTSSGTESVRGAFVGDGQPAPRGSASTRERQAGGVLHGRVAASRQPRRSRNEFIVGLANAVRRVVGQKYSPAPPPIMWGPPHPCRVIGVRVEFHHSIGRHDVPVRDSPPSRPVLPLALPSLSRRSSTRTSRSFR